MNSIINYLPELFSIKELNKLVEDKLYWIEKLVGNDYKGEG